MSDKKQKSGFTGFKTIKYPLYTVVLPQTGETYEVRTLKVGETQKLKESLLTSNRLNDIMTKVIWDCIINKPDNIATYDDFINNVTIKDRSALIYGLYYSTFGNVRPYVLECGNCENRETVKIDLDKAFSMNAHPQAKAVMSSYKIARLENPDNKNEEMENELQKNEKAKYPKKPTATAPPKGMPEEIARNDDKFNKFFEQLDETNVTYTQYVDGYIYGEGKEDNKENIIEQHNKEYNNFIIGKSHHFILPNSNVHVYIKQPTIEDENELLANLSLTNKPQIALAVDTLIIEKLIEYDDESKEPVQIIDDKEDLVAAFLELPEGDRDFIVEKYEELFGQYEIKLTAKWKCKNLDCGHENELNIDLLDQFFRTLLST